MRIAIFLILIALCPLSVLASSTDGTIDTIYKYAWGENVGWVNFGTSGGGVRVTDSGLTGYIWSENFGWINLSPSTSGVQNNSEGFLSGYAWGQNLGWINFSGVTINSSGEFSGFASGDNTGQISFNCPNCRVKTDWRPLSLRTISAGLGGGIPGSASGNVPQPRFMTIALPGLEIIERLPEILKPFTPEFLKPKLPEVKPPEVPLEELVSKEAPLAMKGQWQLLASRPLEMFVLAPLPREIQTLAEKFPQLEKTFEKVGLARFTDLEKLRTAELSLPGLTETLGLATTKIETGKFAMPQGIPIAQLSPQVKQRLPAEIVFPKTAGELIDFNINLSITEKGKPEQKISTISGKPLQLAIKPEKPVKSVKGYMVFKSKANPAKAGQKPEVELRLNSLLASVFFAAPSFAKTYDSVEIETRLVLLEFEYTDPDGDGIYTAEIQAPVVEGEYEIITVMDYEDPKLVAKEIRLITVVDPEGYVYEKEKDKETRVPGAIIYLYWLNPETKQYELWPAKEYQQENPQITDTTGKYSFLVPEGSYYLKVEAPGYLPYDGKPFGVKEGSGIHVNIELKTKYWWLKVVDWKTILLVAVILLLLYNFYKDKTREKRNYEPR